MPPLNYLAAWTLLALLLAACAPTRPPSAWGPLLILARAPQIDAPALAVGGGQVALAWVGRDPDGVHHDARMLRAGALTETVILPLPPRRPYQQRFYPADGGRFHLLWLDADPDGLTRLYSALLSADLTVERGPVAISEGRALRYAAVPTGTGDLWALWSGDPIAEPALMARRIDAAGRPGPEATLARDADWPVILPTATGEIAVYWLRPRDGAIFGAALGDSVLHGAQDTGLRLAPRPGDRLESIEAGQDQTHRYLLWNVTRAEGGAQTLYSARPHDAPTWTDPHPLSFAPIPDTIFNTGFNTGPASAADAGDEMALIHASALIGGFDLLAVAGQAGDQLALLYLRGGVAVGYQPIMEAALLGPPALTIDRDRHLYLTWSQFDPEGPATLLLMTTRPSG